MSFLSGDQVELEPLDPSRDAHVEVYRRSRNHPAMRATGAYETGLVVDEAREAIRQRRGGDGACCAIRAEGEALGWAHATITDDRARVAEVGYYVLPAGQGKGYATDAVRTLVAFAFDELNANSVAARIRADNEPSRRVVEKLGFTHEGTRRESLFAEGAYHDVAVFGLLADEVEATRNGDGDTDVTDVSPD